MATWLEPSTVTAVLGSSLSEQLDPIALAAILPGVREWVEGKRSDLRVEAGSTTPAVHVYDFATSDEGWGPEAGAVTTADGRLVITAGDEGAAASAVVRLVDVGALVTVTAEVTGPVGGTVQLTVQAGATAEDVVTREGSGAGSDAIPFRLDTPQVAVSDAFQGQYLIRLQLAELIPNAVITAAKVTVAEVGTSTFAPTEDVVLGAAFLVYRLYQRRTTPLGILGATEDGYTGIIREDPDIARLLGIGAAGRFVFGGHNPDAQAVG